MAERSCGNCRYFRPVHKTSGECRVELTLPPWAEVDESRRLVWGDGSPFDLAEHCALYEEAPRPGTAEWFHDLRNNPEYHLGCGDVRLTMGMQEEIADCVAELEAKIEEQEEDMAPFRALIDKHKAYKVIPAKYWRTPGEDGDHASGNRD